MTLPVGSAAPSFIAQMPDGSDVALSDLRGKWVLLFFYPRDFTPGCTMESCSLNHNLSGFEDLGAAVVGVSSQSRGSHEKFQARFSLRYPLVADSDRSIGAAYDVPARGITSKSSARVSFLIDPEGRIAHVWDKVSPAKHAAEALATLEAQARAT